MDDYIPAGINNSGSMGFAELHRFKPPKQHRLLHSDCLEAFTSRLTVTVGICGMGFPRSPSVLFLATNHPL